MSEDQWNGSRKRCFEVHFVPIARDRCSTVNLTETLTWLREHDVEAQAIAKAREDLSAEAFST